MTFDPREVSYDQLLDVFWQIHDPTQLNRQGPDVGDQYRSAIFTHGAEQERDAIASRDREQQKHSRPIVTQILPAPRFWPAEEYHQRYFEKNGGACHIVPGAHDETRGVLRRGGGSRSAALGVRTSAAARAAYEVTHTDAQWRAILGSRSLSRFCGEGGTEPAFSSPLITEKPRRGLSLRRLRSRALLFQDEVRQRRRLAVVLGRAPERDANAGRLRAHRGAHRSALPPLRGSSRPYLRRRAGADAPALLHRRVRAASSCPSKA